MLRSLLFSILSSIILSPINAQSLQAFKKQFDKIETLPWLDMGCSDSGINVSSSRRSLNSLQAIMNKDTASVPFLIELLTDTTVSKIFSCCLNRHLRKNEVALFLLKKIDQFIEQEVCNVLWDDYDSCVPVSISFFYDFGENYKQFSELYRKYYSSPERLARLRTSQFRIQ